MNHPKKIVLLQLMSNGDCLYATAVARQIKNDFPGCSLTWIIASFCKNIIDNNPYVDVIEVIPDVSKSNCVPIIRRLRKELSQRKVKGEIDEFFFTQVVDSNQANYDGSIRSSIFRGYDRPITVPVTPVLRLRDEEIARVKTFVEKFKLTKYKHVILFEFAPQSGQLAMTPAIAVKMANEIIRNEHTAVILSSNIKLGDEFERIIDGSTLTLRETAALTHYCTLLLGCSSGITWISTSDAAKQLPMVQVLDPNAYWVNPISRDFERFGLPGESVIELYEFNDARIIECINDVLNNGFLFAREKFFSVLPLQFKTARRSIYNMLCFFQFKSIVKLIRINIAVFGWNPLLIKEIAAGFTTAPFRLVYNTITKRLMKKS